MWAQLGSNQRPPDYESGAANHLSYGPEITGCKYNIKLKYLQTFYNAGSPKGNFYHMLIFYNAEWPAAKITNRTSTILYGLRPKSHIANRKSQINSLPTVC